MKKGVLISPIGLSPAVITEVLYSVGEVEGITDVSIIATEHPKVMASAKLAKIGIEEEYPKMRGKKVYVHLHMLDIEDVNTTENAIEFVKAMTEIMRKEVEIHKPTRIIFNIAGARKVESAIILMLGMIWRVQGIYHVVHKDVGSFNEHVERVRSEIDGILEADDEKEYYNRYRNIFFDILFPDPHDYSVFEIPFVPFSRTEINMLKQLLRGTSLRDTLISDYEIRLYRKMDLITHDSERTYPTELGQVFLKVLEVL